MDRSVKKRKAAPAGSPEGREAKRQKTPDPFYVPKTNETPETVSKIGGEFIESLKRAKDKNGGLICTSFLTLPSKKQFPDYYQQVVMPIAVDTLEAKLERYGYSQLTGLESDVKRMVNNAKTYNNSKSDIYLDAERIRKMTSNYMVKHNPAYKDKNYAAFPTPLPSEREAEEEEEEEQEEEEASAKTEKRSTRGGTTPHESLKTSRLTERMLDPDEDGYDPDFTGKTFQQAQRQLMNEMIKHKDDSDLEVFTPFVNLPPRSLTEYYETIKQPVSLRSVMNKVIGFHGRAGATGFTELKSWDAFEGEMRKIWENCREFNQEDSEIYSLAGELEAYFAERLAEAKAKVEEPAQPTLKLNLAAKAAPIKLRLGVKPSPSPAPGTPAAATPKQVASKSTKPNAAAEPAKTIHLSTKQTPAIPSPSPAPQTKPPIARTTSALAKSPSRPAAAAVKPEAIPAPVPVVTPTPAAATAMAPPQAAPTSGISSTTSAITQPIQPYVPYMAPPTGLDSKWRRDGKGADDALITSLLITSHPSLALSRPFHHTLPAQSRLSHQSLTLTLPYTHSLLQFEPTLNPALGGAPASTPALTNGTLGTPGTPTPAPANVERRPYKLFVLVNGNRVQANFLPGQARLQYDVRLGVGTNRIEVECIAAANAASGGQLGSLGGAAAGGSGGSPAKGEDLELERISCFVFVMRL